MAQLNYSYETAKGVAGGLFDITDYEINSRTVENNNGVVKFGTALVQGTSAGHTVKAPTATTDKFEGVAVNGLTTEHDTYGEVVIKKGDAIGVLAHGKVWVRLAKSVVPTYGDKVYVVADGGDDNGLFTNAAGTTADNTATTIELNATFVEVDKNEQIAAIAIAR